MLKKELKAIDPETIVTIHFNDGAVYCPVNADTPVTIQEDAKRRVGLAVWTSNIINSKCLAFWYPKDIKRLELCNVAESAVS